MTNKYKCVICKCECEGYGNNPWPVEVNTKRCCDNCNQCYVIPIRIMKFKSDMLKEL